MENKSIALASDHAGFDLRQKVHQLLVDLGYDVHDYGTPSADSCDYPDYAHPAGAAVNAGRQPQGIVICGSGNGVQMTVNKYPNVRCALCWNVELAQLARQHNNANMIALPARFIPEELALDIVRAFLSTDFEGGRHERRVEKIPHLLQ